jgi:hypothetical protein
VIIADDRAGQAVAGAQLPPTARRGQASREPAATAGISENGVSARLITPSSNRDPTGDFKRICSGYGAPPERGFDAARRGP